MPPPRTDRVGRCADSGVAQVGLSQVSVAHRLSAVRRAPRRPGVAVSPLRSIFGSADRSGDTGRTRSALVACLRQKRPCSSRVSVACASSLGEVNRRAAAGERIEDDMGP